jgi:3-mercaptopyruvate sulfurtransferase SseA
MELPLIVEPERLAESLGAENLLVVDLCKAQTSASTQVPGAVNFDWVNAIDQQRNLRLKPAEELRTLLETAGVTPDREVIVYCQTHHRSSHTYVVLKSLGYPRIKGYPGAWSEWGNLTDTPIET